MAKETKRQRVNPVFEKLNSWKEVDIALSEIAQKSAAAQVIINDYNEREMKLREEVLNLTTPNKNRIADLEQSIQAYCEEHRDEFVTKKSRDLSSGTVGFRTTPPKVSQIKGYTKASIINLLKKAVAWKDKFIKISEELDKETILSTFAGHHVDNVLLADFGLSVTQEDTFGYTLKEAIQ